jgi:hypothetical protein
MPYALGMLEPEDRPAMGAVGVEPIARGPHDESWPQLWAEMTMVRRSEPAGVAW